MSEFVDLGGTIFQVTYGQSTDDDRESLEFRVPGDMLGFVFEIAQYGDWGSSDVRVVCPEEVPADVLLAAIPLGLKHFGVAG